MDVVDVVVLVGGGGSAPSPFVLVPLLCLFLAAERSHRPP